MNELRFTVLGKPQPAGSKRAMPIYRNGPHGKQLVTRANGSPVIAITDANSKSRSWKNDVAHAVRDIYDGDLLRCPLTVEFLFVRPRPKGHFRKNGEFSKEGLAATAPVSKPDVLKLARAVEDALTGILWHDDAQICRELLTKQFGEPARVEIIVSW